MLRELWSAYMISPAANFNGEIGNNGCNAYVVMSLRGIFTTMQTRRLPGVTFFRGRGIICTRYRFLE